MSKIAEKKALEEYPLPKEESYSTSFINQETFNSSKRTGYIKGYDQAIQDFLEKAITFLNGNLLKVLLFDISDKKQFVEQFKNYMQNE